MWEVFGYEKWSELFLVVVDVIDVNVEGLVYFLLWE